MVVVLIDIDGQRSQTSHLRKAIDGRVIEVEPIHRAYPGAPLAVVQDGIRAGATQTVGLVTMRVVSQRTGCEIQHVDASRIGANPQFLAFQRQRMDIG